VNVLTVLLALLSALANGAASVLQRRAAVDQQAGDRQTGKGVKESSLRLARLLGRPFWLAGAAAMAVSAVAQAGALAVGRLSVVQPLLVSELLFTLLCGSLVFHRRPGGRTWLSFVVLASGLAMFLIAADPSLGRSTAHNGRWLPVGALLAAVVAILLAVARPLGGAARAAVLGCATAVGFACTAALIKELTGRFSDGAVAVLTGWQLYAVCGVGLISFLLLQSTFRVGSLVVSQPALTLGDALVSVALGWVLFGERVALGLHIVPEVAGACLIAAGTVGLTRSPAVAGGWDADAASARPRPKRTAHHAGPAAPPPARPERAGRTRGEDGAP
jgi:drug/metabolite transporter (DMT)-like permease